MQETFLRRKGNPLFNTSYPLSPRDWMPYRVSAPLSFAGEQEVSFYIHIPFCRQLCSFCEYTRVLCPDETVQQHYVNALEQDVHRFVEEYGTRLRLRGFDIGGGTPTALADEPFRQLLLLFRRVVEQMDTTPDFEPSIEGTFETLTPEKAESIVQAGIRRVSLGVQSSSSDVLSCNHRRPVQPDRMRDVISFLHDKGVRKVNLDFMYGLKGQTQTDMAQDLAILQLLNPEQVTLYELRTNMIAESPTQSSEQLFRQYSFLYDGLISLGYQARFGQNTFSKDAHDVGVSSYLRSRMLHGTAYKGFGISAQSMCRDGVAYNVGKLAGNVRHLLEADTFPEAFTYRLPPHELASKYLAISAYNGSFSLSTLSRILGEDSRQHYASPLDFCLSQSLLARDGDLVYITPKGFQDYGAVFSLFYVG